MNDTLTRLRLGQRDIIIVGTAHVSRESIEEVAQVIREEQPGRVCVEIDANRYRSMTDGASFSRLDIYQVLKEKKGFLLLANLVLSAFQRRLGLDLGVKPGQEMMRAIETAQEQGIPFSFCDRDIQVTLRRAWMKSSLWGRSKMLAALVASVFSSEKLSTEQIEELKKKSALEGMMEELADYLPSVKEVLIDERDRFLATRIFETTESRVVAVIGAGHASGMIGWLRKLEAGEASTGLSDIEHVPPKRGLGGFIPWLVPVLVLVLVGVGFARSGWDLTLQMLFMWILVNGSLSAIGALVALAHPLTVVVSFVAAPITSMNPTIGVGFVSGFVEALFRKPRVQDFENLHQDVLSIRGFYRNRFTHALLVFFFSSVGSAIGTFIGIPFLSALLT